MKGFGPSCSHLGECRFLVETLTIVCQEAENKAQWDTAKEFMY
jgi:hypothetical protein